MREYLYELRKQINKTQSEISQTLKDKCGIDVKYAAVERGDIWSTLTVNNRAEALALALNSTPEYILKCERKQGGYVGKHFDPKRSNQNKHLVPKHPEYNRPLTLSERKLAEKYISYVENKIRILKITQFKNIPNKILNDADYYDIGMLYFIYTIKKLSSRDVPIEEDPRITNADAFYKYIFKRALIDGFNSCISNYIIHKNGSEENSLDSNPLANKGDSDNEELYDKYECIMIPVQKQVESSCFLSYLYSCLDDKQITACKLLIKGWQQKEIINAKKATKTDFGVIKFYVKQINEHGKVIWNLKDFLRVAPNISFSVKDEVWVVKIYKSGKHYSLGQYKDLNIALDVQAEMQLHIDHGDFKQWYEAHLTSKTGKKLYFKYF